MASFFFAKKTPAIPAAHTSAQNVVEYRQKRKESLTRWLKDSLIPHLNTEIATASKNGLVSFEFVANRGFLGNNVKLDEWTGAGWLKEGLFEQLKQALAADLYIVTSSYDQIMGTYTIVISWPDQPPAPEVIVETAVPTPVATAEAPVAAAEPADAPAAAAPVQPSA